VWSGRKFVPGRGLDFDSITLPYYAVSAISQKQGWFLHPCAGCLHLYPLIHSNFLTMRKLLFFLTFIGLPFFISAQTFLKAPKDSKHIKQIIEWTTFAADETDPEETVKEGVYTFRKDGQLLQYVTNNSLSEVFDYEYDGQNRLLKVQIKNEESTKTMTYQYFADRQMAEIHEPGSDLRTIQYFNKKGQVVEEKAFLKGKLSDGKWATLNRTVFNYNDRDSLFGEMLYQIGSTGAVATYKTIHLYDPVTNKKSDIIYKEPDGKPNKLVSFQYDEQGRLVKKKIEMPLTGEKSVTDYIYQKGKLWQSITKGKTYRNEKIYKDGRLIRSKDFDRDGKLLWHTDYQYVFY
jgi:YD repeat-containing protein